MQKINVLLVCLTILLVSCSPHPFTGKTNTTPLIKGDAYVVVIPKSVIDEYPEVKEVINGILIENQNSVRNFMLTNSNGKFNLAVEFYVVEQQYPNMFSVISDLDDQVNFRMKKGVFIVYDGDCNDVDRGGGGLPLQEFVSNDGPVSLRGITIADCSIFESSGEERARYVFLHELAHSLINTPGHANLVLSIVYDPFGDYQRNPTKAKSECSIPFNSMDPEIRALTPTRGCPVSEYSDPLDILGGNHQLLYQTIYSIFEKQRAGFISETAVNTLELRERGTFRPIIYPHDAVDPENYLTHVKIMKGRYGFYSIEYRTELEPLFSTSKVIIRYAFEEGGNTFLIAAFSPEEIYNNPTDNFSVTFNEARDSAAIEVQLR